MFCVRLCRVTIEIDNRYGYVETLCRDYAVNAEDEPVFRVSVSHAELEGYLAEVGRPMSFEEAESYLIYRKICGQMPAYGAYLLHAAVVTLDGRGYAFSARRGVGKTTHAALWESTFGATVINGDKPLVKKEVDGTYTAWGTPWCGKEGKQINTAVPLTALCFLEQGEVNEIVPASTADTAARILEATLLPPTPALQEDMASLVGATVRDIPALILTCRPDEEAVITAYQALSQA